MVRPVLPRDEQGNIIRPKHDPFARSRKLIEKNSRQLTQAAIKLALAGNAPILNRLLAYGLPVMRAAEPAVSWPGVSAAQSLEENAAAIIAHALAGHATASQAIEAIEMLNAQIELRKNGSMVEEIARLFEAHGLELPERLRVMRNLHNRGA